MGCVDNPHQIRFLHILLFHYTEIWPDLIPLGYIGRLSQAQSLHYFTLPPCVELRHDLIFIFRICRKLELGSVITFHIFISLLVFELHDELILLGYVSSLSQTRSLHSIFLSLPLNYV